MQNISQTQLSNFMTIAGLIVLVLPKLGLVATQDQVTFVLTSIWSIGWSVYNAINRYKKGDINVAGIRKY